MVALSEATSGGGPDYCNRRRRVFFYHQDRSGNMTIEPYATMIGLHLTQIKVVFGVRG